MTCPDLDLYAGLDVPADVRAHVANCDACSAELAAAMALAAGFAEMRAEAAPPAVVDAALLTARAQPASSRQTRPGRPARDRSAAPRAVPRHTWRAAGVAAALLVALAAGLWLRPDAEPARVADAAVPAVTEPADAQPVAAPAVSLPVAPPDVRPTPAPDVRPTPAPQAEADTRAEPPVQPTPRAEPPPSPSRLLPEAPAPAPVAPIPADSARPSDDLVAAPPTAVPDSVAAARDGVLLAFGVVAEAQRTASRSVEREMQRIGSTLSDAARDPLSLTP